MSMSVPAFEGLVRSRRSPREFLPTEVPAAAIRGVLLDAQSAPSNSNTQPWIVHVVSGQTKETLSEALLEAFEAGRTSLDFTATYGDGVHHERAKDHAAVHYGLRGIARSDRAGRDDVMRENLRFYGAPHAALLFMPQLGDGVRAAGDVGMYAQNFLLSLTARGYHGIPQTVIGMFADTAREVLDVPADLKLLFAIGFGTAHPTSPLKSLDLTKVPLQNSVIVHDTPGVLQET
jgi:nitroreductase